MRFYKLLLIPALISGLELAIDAVQGRDVVKFRHARNAYYGEEGSGSKVFGGAQNFDRSAPQAQSMPPRKRKV